MGWWMWLVLGLLLMAGEMITPGGFYLLFFGLGAMATGTLALFFPDMAAWIQWLLFTLFSVAAVLVLRGRLKARFSRSTGRVDSLLDDTAVAMEDIGVNEIGKAELRGSAWSARNAGDQPIAKGQRCRVEKMEGLMLFIRRA